MFTVMRDLEPGHARCIKSVYKCSQRAIAFTGKLNLSAVPEQTGQTAYSSIAALSLERTQAPRSCSIHVFAPEHGFKFSTTDFAAQAVHFLVCYRAEIPLHFFGQLDTKLTFQQVGNAAFT